MRAWITLAGLGAEVKSGRVIRAYFHRDREGGHVRTDLMHQCMRAICARV